MSAWDTGEVMPVTRLALETCLRAYARSPDLGYAWRNFAWVARSMLRLINGETIRWGGKQWRLVEVSDESA